MRIVNLEILGHPINILMIVGIVVLFWFAMFVLSNKGVLPTATAAKDN